MTPAAALQALSLLCIVLFGILLVFFGFLMAAKARAGRERSAVMLWTERYVSADSVMMEYIRSGGTSRNLLFADGARREGLLSALTQLAGMNRSSATASAISRFAELHLTVFLRKQLRSKIWSDRVNALLYIEQLRVGTVIHELEHVLQQRRCTDIERFLSVRAMARIEAGDAVRCLEQLEPRFSDFQVLQIMFLLPAALLNEWTGKFATLPPRLQLSLIDALRIRNMRSEQVLALLEHSANCEFVELRIRALKSLANFGYMSPEGSASLLERIGRSEDAGWEERLMQAKLMGSVREEEFLDALESMMGDAVYLVRQEAAHAIAQYKGGLNRLSVISSFHRDRYAREMAEEAIERIRYERRMA